MNNANAFELYGKHKNLYLFNTGKGSVLFKPLSYDKCETAKRICNNFPALAPVVEDNIWEECVIEHTLQGNVHTLNAGIISTIVRLIIHFSNPRSIDSIEDSLDALRSQVVDIREEIVLKICQAFPGYKPEEVESMEWEMQLKRLVQAEKVLGTRFEFVKNDPTPANKPFVKLPGSEPKMKLGKDGNQYIDFDKENASML